MAVSLLTMVSLLSGCPAQSGRGGGPPVSGQTALSMAEGLYERGAGLTSFAARGRVNYHRSNQRHFFRFEFLSQKPGRMLFTAFDPAGRPAFKLLIRDGKLSGVLYGDRQFVQGEATRENLSRFIPVNLSPGDLLALMTGAQVKPISASGREVRGGDLSELTISPDGQGPGLMRYAQAPENGEVWKLVIKGPLTQKPFEAAVAKASYCPTGGKPEISLSYNLIEAAPREDLPGAPSEPFPMKVSAQWAKGESLEINYDEIRLGAKLDDNLFALSPPREFEIVPLY